MPVTVITNPCNIGFPAAVNQGLQVASGEYLVLLNNDAVVTEGWLEQLIALTLAPVDRGSGDEFEAAVGKIPPEGGTPAAFQDGATWESRLQPVPGLRVCSKRRFRGPVLL